VFLGRNNIGIETKQMIKKVLPFLVVALVACDLSDSNYYTLYRNSTSDGNMRIHVATFDATTGLNDSLIHSYNFENCQIAQELFQRQDGVRTKFWCEKGRFRK
jgi:hypothetical protein